jgi:alpha-glucosidase
MKRWLLHFLAIFAGLTSTGQPKTQLLSPDKTIRIEIQATSRLSYRVYTDNKIILDESIIDMILADGRSLSGKMKIVKTETRSIRTTILAQIHVSRKYIPDEFNELTLQFNNRFAIIFRAYNDGVAYRIRTSFSDSIVVKIETAAFHFAPGAIAMRPWYKRGGSGCFHTSFEELYPYKKLDSLSDKDYMYSPVLVKQQQIYLQRLLNRTLTITRVCFFVAQPEMSCTVLLQHIRWKKK